MVGMPAIDILDVCMDDKMLALVCWNLMCFLCFCDGHLFITSIYNIYLRKIAGKYTTFKEKCWKNFYRNL